MRCFFKISDKQLLEDRNDLLKEVGIPGLTKNGFSLSPFNGAWHGEYHSNSGYNYDFCRISQNSFLEVLDISIHPKDRNINIYLCVFELSPSVNSITQLLGLEGSPFAMTVKNKSKYMQLRLDEYKGPPIFHMYSPEHKIGRFFTKSGYKTELRKLKKLIKADMENIDRFVERWHELHKPNQTDWNGNVIILKKNTFEKIQAFIVEKIGVDELEVTRDTLLQDDLGVYGDDALELLIAFSNKFNVDISMFPIDDYFKGEGLTFTLLPTIRKIKPLNVGQLEKAVAVGRLDEEVINS